MPEPDPLQSRSVVLIPGFLPGVDEEPRAVRVAAPYGRFAVVVNTHYPEFAGGFFFDHELVLKLCEVIVQSRPTQVRGFPREARTLEALGIAWREAWRTDDRDDPLRDA